MPLSSHARTLADIFQRRGDVLARTEMAKHQALAQGLQGVGGALGDWLTQKQETKEPRDPWQASGPYEPTVRGGGPREHAGPPKARRYS
jgi:hypothetical protein